MIFCIAVNSLLPHVPVIPDNYQIKKKKKFNSVRCLEICQKSPMHSYEKNRDTLVIRYHQFSFSILLYPPNSSPVVYTEFYLLFYINLYILFIRG